MVAELSTVQYVWEFLICFYGSHDSAKLHF